MIDNSLWKSAVLTIICGVDPDHYGRTYEDIVQQASSDDCRIRDFDHNYVSLLLDLCATCSKDFEQYIMGACITSKRVLVEGKTTSNLIGRFLGRRLGFDVMPQQVPDMGHWKAPHFNCDSLHWYHIPFTNVSLHIISCETFVLNSAGIDGAGTPDQLPICIVILTIFRYSCISI
jgi:hypothetical protein